jgi:CMP-N-acetylneuraminic acid synthetase
MKILGLITARGGSKTIPRKNLKELGGKPLIIWTIETAKKSGVLDRLVLSTDDRETAEVAKSYDVEVPFMRPAELAQDTTPHLPVLQHAAQWLKENENYQPEEILLLQPTAPFRQPFHIQEAVKLFQQSSADSLVSVSEVPGDYNPYWVYKLNENLYLEPFTGGSIKTPIPRRQDLPKVYARNGAIYLFKTDLLFDPVSPSFYGEKILGYVMDEKYSVNLNSPLDWLVAESMIRELGLA